jgi:T-complex protein 1 subunit gamma
LLEEKAKSITGVHQWPFRALARSFEVIPRTLIQNCGANVIRTLTALRAKHTTEGNGTWGVDGDTGEIVDMNKLGIWEPLSVKQQTYKTAVEVTFICFFIDKVITAHSRFMRKISKKWKKEQLNDVEKEKL